MTAFTIGNDRNRDDEFGEHAPVVRDSSPRRPGECIVVYRGKEADEIPRHIEFAWLDVVFVILHRILLFFFILHDFLVSLFFQFALCHGLGRMTSHAYEI